MAIREAKKTTTRHILSRQLLRWDIRLLVLWDVCDVCR